LKSSVVNSVKAWHGNSCIVHQNIYGSEVLDGGFDSFGSGLLLADVAIREDPQG
jgi:hypothetical protein